MCQNIRPSMDIRTEDTTTTTVVGMETRAMVTARDTAKSKRKTAQEAPARTVPDGNIEEQQEQYYGEEARVSVTPGVLQPWAPSHPSLTADIQPF